MADLAEVIMLAEQTGFASGMAVGFGLALFILWLLN